MEENGIDVVKSFVSDADFIRKTYDNGYLIEFKVHIDFRIAALALQDHRIFHVLYSSGGTMQMFMPYCMQYQFLSI